MYTRSRLKKKAKRTDTDDGWWRWWWATVVVVMARGVRRSGEHAAAVSGSRPGPGWDGMGLYRRLQTSDRAVSGDIEKMQQTDKTTTVYERVVLRREDRG